jgi:hypothetical protein
VDCLDHFMVSVQELGRGKAFVSLVALLQNPGIKFWMSSCVESGAELAYGEGTQFVLRWRIRLDRRGFEPRRGHMLQNSRVYAVLADVP